MKFDDRHLIRFIIHIHDFTYSDTIEKEGLGLLVRVFPCDTTKPTILTQKLSDFQCGGNYSDQGNTPTSNPNPSFSIVSEYVKS